MTVFVDTGVLFAAAHAGDRSHAAAKRILEVSGSDGAVTTDHVLVECWSLLNARIGRHAAMRFWSAVRYAPLEIELTTRADLERAQAIAERWADQSFSLVDCTSFAVMERLGCYRAASFDRDFAVYRFGPSGTRAFEILRA